MVRIYSRVQYHPRRLEILMLHNHSRVKSPQVGWKILIVLLIKRAVLLSRFVQRKHKIWLPETPLQKNLRCIITCSVKMFDFRYAKQNPLLFFRVQSLKVFLSFFWGKQCGSLVLSYRSLVNLIQYLYHPASNSQNRCENGKKLYPGTYLIRLKHC